MQIVCTCAEGWVRVSRTPPAGARGPGLWHRGEVSAEVACAAFQRFVEALNHPRDAMVLGAAVTDDVRIERHGPGERGVAAVAETFDGVAAVARWLLRTPPVAGFSLAGAPAPESGPEAHDADPAAGPAWIIEYALDAGEFHNGGIWLARLAGDGRIAFLSHHPFALRDAPAER
jgi:hypothetical protein